MDAYQYFFDTDGEQTGYKKVGIPEYHEANHNHWHFEDFSKYSLLDAEMAPVERSRKQSWCLVDTDQVDLSSACGGRRARSIREVLSSGSGDTYFQYRKGQSIPIEGLTNGIYYLKVEANPNRTMVESDLTNNVSLRKIKLGGRPGSRTVKVFKVGIIDDGTSATYLRERS
jgi:hypothetical protein